MDDDEIAKGERAQQLLKDDVLLSVFKDLEDEFIVHWKASPVRDHEGREEIYRLLRASNAVRNRLEVIAGFGKMKQKQREDEETAKKRQYDIETQIAREIDLDPKYFIRDEDDGA